MTQHVLLLLAIHCILYNGVTMWQYLLKSVNSSPPILAIGVLYIIVCVQSCDHLFTVLCVLNL